MMYFLAIICPPLATLFSGRYVGTLLNIVLTLLGWIPGMIHAMLVVGEVQAEKRNNKLINAMKK
jgi:uncharacterized membrane protein YqaE (UPF0057 family)